MPAKVDSTRILSTSSAAFADRIEAGNLLAEQLQNYSDSKPVVLGIPRGGVTIAAQIAQSLQTDLDIILTHKLGAPNNPELAIGAVSEDGRHFVVKDIAFSVAADVKYIEQEKTRQMREMDRKVKLYRAVCPKLALAGRVVIATDDGVATGSTMQAALWAIWKEKPKKVVLALPVGPRESIECLSKAADETLCLRAPPFFHAIGQFYQRFEQIEDEELLELLKKENQRRGVK